MGFSYVDGWQAAVDRDVRLSGKNRSPTPSPADPGSLTKLVRAWLTRAPLVRSSPGTFSSMELEESSRSKRSTGRRSACHDWTSKVGTDGQPHVGHSWPRRFGPGFPGGSAESWISVLDEAGCAPGVSLIEMGSPDPHIKTVGSGGGYGGIYCFALSP